jgi:hypothetical protein
MEDDGSSSSSSSDGGVLPGRDRQWLNFTLPEMTVLVSRAAAACTVEPWKRFIISSSMHLQGDSSVRLCMGLGQRLLVT